MARGDVRTVAALGGIRQSKQRGEAHTFRNRQALNFVFNNRAALSACFVLCMLHISPSAGITGQNRRLINRKAAWVIDLQDFPADTGRGVSSQG
jgi:hypothetical protein